MRQWRLAVTHLTEALALSIEGKQPLHEALALRNLGNTYADMADFARAEPLLKRALAIFETMPKERGPYMATLVCPGAVYVGEHKPVLAEDAFMRALQMNGGLEATDAQPALVLEFLAALHVQQKRFGDAAELANRAYRTMKRTFSEESPNTAVALGLVAVVEEQSG